MLSLVVPISRRNLTKYTGEDEHIKFVVNREPGLNKAEGSCCEVRRRDRER